MSQEATGFTIRLNGAEHSIGGDGTLTALIAGLGLKPGRIAVEINREIVPRADYARVTLRPGDQIEIINFVGGG